MKKYILGILIIFVLIFGVGTIKCHEILISINEYANNIQVNNVVNTVKDKDTDMTETKSATEQKVRVVIMDSEYSSIYHKNVVIKAGKKIAINYGKDGRETVAVNKDRKITQDDKIFKDCDVIELTNTKNNTKFKNILRNDKASPYKGKIYLYNTDKGIVVVNELDLEEYVAAVVSSEISINSHSEALKVQAVCARTFIMNKIINDKNKKYKEFEADCDDSTGFQVYNINQPNDNVNKAVNETSGQVIKYNNKLINAYYFSTSCGYTTNYRIWGKTKMKYLQEIRVSLESPKTDISDDEFDEFITNTECKNELEYDYPFFRWNVKMSASHLEYSVESYLGYDIGEIEKIEINKRGKGGIVSNITVYGTDKQVSISNQNDIRKALNPYNSKINLNDGSVRENMSILPSAFFTLEPVMKNGKLWGYKIYGGGFGHGAGLSQNAAKEMAEKGMSYKEILGFFYEKTAIVQLDE